MFFRHFLESDLGSVLKQKNDKISFKKALFLRDFVISPVSKHFPYSRDFVVSHVYSYIPYSKNLVVSMFFDTFRIQGNWSFPCFLTHSMIKGIYDRSCLSVCLS